jgi:hypothetical protein
MFKYVSILDTMVTNDLQNRLQPFITTSEALKVGVKNKKIACHLDTMVKRII